jgi:hypothetical protein
MLGVVHAPIFAGLLGCKLIKYPAGSAALAGYVNGFSDYEICVTTFIVSPTRRVKGLQPTWA